MKRRTLLISGVLALWVAGAAHAQSFQDSVVEQLRSQGFSQINVSRTWLGRAQIEATSATQRREIILNPRTGEILRDFSEALTGPQAATTVIINSEGSDDGSSGSGGSGSDDGGDDDGGDGGDNSGSGGDDHGGEGGGGGDDSGSDD